MDLQIISQERLEQLRVYNDEASRFSGVILNEMANLELYVNLYIASYFCPDDFDKVDEMQLLILGDNRTTLGGKIDIFHNIAKAHDKEWMDQYKGEKTLFKDLVHVMEQRNVFAHRIIDLDSFTNERPVGTVRFLTFKNTLDKIDYDIPKFEKLYLLICNICNYFHQKHQPIHNIFPLKLSQRVHHLIAARA